MSCSTNELDYQPFPRKGLLAQNSNLSFDQLIQRLRDEEATVYCYIIDTIKNRNGVLVQIGSAPNFQGELITLCTCKHHMRTFRNVESWPGTWIAGFTGVEAGGRRNALVYLMKVACAFESYYDLWDSPAVPKSAKQAKLASRSRLGDIFRPGPTPGDPFDPRSYILPHQNHSHIEDNGWHKDIDYKGRNGRRAALLTSDVSHSYLWERPSIFYQFRLHRGQKKSSLNDLLQHLEEWYIL